MFKVLIVEDESIIRDGLKNNIAWAELGFTVAGEVENGLRAVEFINRNEVDVILTDIRMPLMDGIALSEYVSTNRPEIKVIILSGHADFNYAQAAIKNDVCEYLLKPLKIDEIERVLKKIANKLEPKLRIVQQGKTESVMMSHILDNDKLDAKSAQVLEDREMQMAMRCALLAVDNFRIYDNLVRKQIKNYLADYKANVFNREWSGDFSAFIIEDNFVIIVLDKGSENIGIIRKIFDDISDGVNSLECETCTFSCGISEEFFVRSELKEMYIHAYSAVSLRFYQGDCTFAKYEEISGYRSIESEEYNEYKEKENLIVSGIRQNDAGVIETLDEIYAALSAPPYLKPEIAIKILRGIAGAFSDYMIVHRGGTGKDVENEMNNFTSLENMINFLKKCAEDLEKSGDESFGSERTIIKKVKKYVLENYEKSITLKDVEEKFFINKSYFSWLFSKIVGQTFTEYLAGVRIEEAKRLLREEGAIKVYEVAERVGYNDYRNFSKSFKKIVGVTPLKYRETAE